MRKRTNAGGHAFTNSPLVGKATGGYHEVYDVTCYLLDRELRLVTCDRRGLLEAAERKERPKVCGVDEGDMVRNVRYAIVRR